MAAADDLPAALARRDYAAALAILQTSGLPPDAAAQWRAYVLSRTDPEAALAAYRSLAEAGGEKSFDLHIASCLFQLRRYREAQEAAEQGPDCPLRTRLLAHCAARLQPDAGASGEPGEGEAALAVSGALDDRLAAAALAYGRSDYDSAAAVYSELLAQFPDLHALHVSLALCGFMSGDTEGSTAHADAYLASLREHPDSVVAANILACSAFLADGGGSAALAALGALPHQLPAGHAAGALVRHNAVVFSGGHGAMQVLPPLVGVVHEARLNLAMMYCRRRDAARALALLRGLEPATALEHIVKGVACALHGQATGSADAVRTAVECFRAVGESHTESDSAPGRQCLASAALLGLHPEEALPLLECLVEVCPGDEALSWNLGMARAAAGLWAEAADALREVQSGPLADDPDHTSWLVRCLVRGGTPEAAWEVYVRAQARAGPAPAVADLLHLLAADALLEGQHLWAARAYHSLEHLLQQGVAAPAAAAAAGSVCVWEGKRAAVAGALRDVARGRGDAGAVVPELLDMLRGSANPQAYAVAGAIRAWAVQHAGAAVPEGAGEGGL